MKILIFGAGAVGAYFGGRLAQAGADVAVVGRSDYEEVKKNGFEIESIKGDFSFMPSQVVRSAAEYQGEADLIIVASKVLPAIDVPSMIKDAVHKNTVIMLAQNGIAIELRFMRLSRKMNSGVRYSISDVQKLLPVSSNTAAVWEALHSADLTAAKHLLWQMKCMNCTKRLRVKLL